MNIYIKIIALVGFFFWSSQEAKAQCYSNDPVTAAYADPTTSDSPYAEKVLWLTWGANLAESQGNDPYGRERQDIVVGSKSYASVHLGGDSYMCVEARITGIEHVAGTKGFESYIPGTYEGDFLDILYNIDGSGITDNLVNNRMVSGIANKMDNGGGGEGKLTFVCKASIDGVPVRLAGLVVADAESLASVEHIYATAQGTWSVVEVHKNESEDNYDILKENNSDGSQTIKFFNGNDKKTGAVAFLSFNENAYNTTGTNPDLSVEFTATLKGGGKTAMAIGLLTPEMDLGDAPESYGYPIHLIQNLGLTSDGIGLNTTVNVNTPEYDPGKLVETKGSYLGTTPPDADSGPMYSRDAMGDDNSGTAGVKEEDAWPAELKQISYKTEYAAGYIIEAKIDYHGGMVGDNISGWIDFNLNGKFDPCERATAPVIDAGCGSVTLEWTVLPTRVPYSTYVRLRYFHSAEDPTSPTSSVNFGEVEDHRIYVLTPGRTNSILPSKAK